MDCTSWRRWRALAAACGLALATSLAGAAYAQDAKKPDFEADLARCRKLVKAEKWKDGEAALRRLFTSYPEDDRVRANLAAIEDDLKLCLFRQGHPRPNGQTLFGRGTRSFKHHTRKASFQFPDAKADGWKSTESGVQFFDVRLDGKIEIEFSGRPVTDNKVSLALFLCYDLEKKGGYVIKPVQKASGTLMYRVHEATEDEQKIIGGGIVIEPDFWNHKWTLRVARKPGRIEVEALAGKLKAKSSKFKSGYIVFLGDVSNITIKARVDLHHYRKRMGEHLNRAFSTWAEKKYDRNGVIPEWARAEAAETAAFDIGETPDDTGVEIQEIVGLVVDALLVFEGVPGLEQVADDETLEELETTRFGDVGGASGRYIRGLVALALGRHLEAERELTAVLEERPEFAPARIFRGRARFRMRKLDEARKDMEQGLKERPLYPHTYAFLADLALHERDVEQAFTILAKARTAGVGHPRVKALTNMVHRARQGPRWTRDYEFRSKHFLVTSDHSLALAEKVSNRLERSQALYAKGLARYGGPKRLSRVYVFSGFESYFRYTRGLRMWVPMTAGLYSPRLRQLLLWVPPDRTDLWRTVRHEGFHQYLDQLVDDAPIWFHEGNAEWFGAERKVVKPRMVDEIDGYADALTPLETLLRMDRTAFMDNAVQHYTQAHDAVMFLRTTKDARFKGLLTAYFKALRGGLSRDEAYDNVFAPVIGPLDSAFRAFVAKR